SAHRGGRKVRPWAEIDEPNPRVRRRCRYNGCRLTAAAAELRPGARRKAASSRNLQARRNRRRTCGDAETVEKFADVTSGEPRRPPHEALRPKPPMHRLRQASW